MRSDDPRQVFAATPVVIVKARQLRAIEIENTDHFVAVKQRHNQFRARSSVAGYVTRESGDIGDKDGSALRRCYAADTSPKGNAHAGREALERANYQFLTVQEVESRPVQRRQRMINRSSCIGGIGYRICLAGQQRVKFAGQFLIQDSFVRLTPDLGPGCESGWIMHSTQLFC
jgi:hypothetical protein